MKNILIVLLLTMATTVLGEEIKPISGGIEYGKYSVAIGSKKEVYTSNQSGQWQKETVWNGTESDKQGYVYLKHLQNYEIRLKSSFPGRSDAKVVIDGKEVGYFRLESNGTLVLERGVHNTNRFTFVQKNSEEFYKIGLNHVDVEKLGLITVTFYPELTYIEKIEAPSRLEKKKTSYSGGTGVSTTSTQRFVDAERMVVDQNKATTIHLRLVVKPDSIETLKPLNGKLETKIPAPKR